MKPNASLFHRVIWSGIGESNPFLRLGRPGHNQYTNPAFFKSSTVSADPDLPQFSLRYNRQYHIDDIIPTQLDRSPIDDNGAGRGTRTPDILSTKQA